MIGRDELISYLDELLEASRGQDFCPNGLQVEGRSTITRLVTGVSACHELFRRAREREADAVLVHHGLFWNGDPRALTGFRYRRVRELIRGELNLIAYHLPLDRHDTFGNNAVAAARLGLSDLEPCAFHAGEPTGFNGRFQEAITTEELTSRCREVFLQDPLVFPEGPEQIHRLAMVSGAAQRNFHEAIDDGQDAFITGEVSEWVMNVARETGVHYLAAGHYATERLGVQALGDHLAERFGLDIEFVEIANPV